MKRSEWTARASLCVGFGLICLSTVAGAQEPAHPTPADGAPDRAVRILATGGLHGHFATPVCDNERSMNATALPFLFEGVARARVATRSPVLVLDTGGLLHSDRVALFAARYQSSELAALVKALGYHALALGLDDLAAPRNDLVATLETLREIALPVVASNLTCDEANATLCRLLIDAADEPLIFKAGTERVAFIALLHEQTLKHVARDRGRGIRIVPPVEAISSATRAARRAGATFVIAVLQPARGSAATGASDALALASSLKEDARPDVVVAAQGGEQLLFARPPSESPAVVALPEPGAVAIDVRHAHDAEQRNLRVHPVPNAAQPHPAFAPWMRVLGPRYCEHWGRPLRGARLAAPGALGQPTAPFGPEALGQLVAEVIRSETASDIAFINRSFVSRSWRPMRTTHLSASDIHIGLPHIETVMTSSVTGAWLLQNADRLSNYGLYAAGLEVQNGRVENDGHTIDPRARYSIATIRFLAEGGDDLLPGDLTWHTWRGPEVQDLMLAFLDVPSSRTVAERVSRLNHSTEWQFRSDIDFDFSATNVSNAPAYNTSLLQRDNTLALGTKSTLRLDADSNQWGWANLGQVQYQKIRTEPRANPSSARFVEGMDLLSLQSTLAWRGLRTPASRWYTPNPFIEAYVESELTKPAERTFHHLLVRPLAGGQFEFTSKLQARVGVGTEGEVFDPNAKLGPGVGAQLVLTPWALAYAGARTFEVDFNLDYFIANLGTLNDQTLRGRIAFTMTLLEPLALTSTVNIFGQKVGGDAVAYALDSLVGLRIRWLTRAAVR